MCAFVFTLGVHIDCLLSSILKLPRTVSRSHKAEKTLAVNQRVEQRKFENSEPGFGRRMGGSVSNGNGQLTSVSCTKGDLGSCSI